MDRRRVSEARQRAALIQAGQRMIARGERPHYAVRRLLDGRWQVVGADWLDVAGEDRGAAVVSARATLAAMLDVESDQFDVES